MKPINLLIGFLIGAATGATLSLLFAPDKGIRTRRKMIYVVKRNNRAMKSRFNNYRHHKNNAISKNQLDKLLDDAYIEAVQNNTDA